MSEMQDEKDVAQKALAALVVSRGQLRVGVYKHYKGGQYVVFAHSIDEATLEPLVHYYSIEKKTRWTRTLKNFLELVTPDTPRFAFMFTPTKSELMAAMGLRPHES